MASCSFQPNTQSPVTTARFFKIILRKTLEDGNLKVPNNFTRKYGGGLQNPVYLNPPDGTEWEVHWTKHDEGILFQKGWKEFAAYYSLDHGHLVVFQYKETSHFELHIFGMNGLEIDYPNDMVDILNEPSPSEGQKRRLKSPLLLSPSTSEKLRSSVRTIPNPEISQSEDIKPELPIVATVNQHMPGKKNRRKQDPKPLISLFPATSEALEEAKKFNSKNPSFIVKILPSHLTRRLCPHFSVIFFRKYFKQDRQYVKIRFKKKLFPARLIYYSYKCTAVISAGWPCFARASKVQAGDVCVFEFINRKDLVFDVHIYRG